MDVAMTGSSGLLGSALSNHLRAEGHRVVPVVRRSPGPDEIGWDIAAGSLMIREAGGLISELQDENDYLETGNIVAGAPKVHDALKTLLQSHLD